MRGLIIATCQVKEKKFDVNFYLNVRFRLRIGIDPVIALKM
jgi:hypothetical protein